MLIGAFSLFLFILILSVIKGVSIVYALLIGLLLFSGVALKMGFKPSQLGDFAVDGVKESAIVIKIMCIIGVLTAVWRISGTISIFIHYGLKLIMPQFFIILVFLLSCLLSYALGTSFGVAATVGVVMMAIARAGDVNPAITAGAVMSGIYFGDRTSPVSSSANMIAAVTDTDIFTNVSNMHKSGAVPFFVSLALYAVFSVMNPLSSVDTSMMDSFSTDSLICFLPAVIVMVLPMMKVSVTTSMIFSILSGIVIALFSGQFGFVEILKICVTGFHGSELLDGGGLLSMVELIMIIIISSSYSGIFKGTNMLESIQNQMTHCCSRFGSFTTMVVLSILSGMMFCSQTIAILSCKMLLEEPYSELGLHNDDLAVDLENTTIFISALIPWNICCYMPLMFMGTDISALPYAFFLYLMPIWWLLKRNARKNVSITV